ncbi:iron-sulfur cluster biosynthesis domain-containing protein [Ditylenchus destructor]|uniref:Iron-sulfur cluster assembly 1 homolog, mitochondrial n=1 Tax=Ditylenchus destructor TaxID=166010 RepID=A0AAD4NJK6_9BILA|nr:iron-sulfur cluster biosynthesis domain-containing protein [Ditylenchus destructor]
MKLSRLILASTKVVKDNSRLRLASSKQAITLSPQAIARAKELLAEKPETAGLKIGVQQRGCNGYTYTLDYADSKGKFDEEVVQDGVRIWVDSKAQFSLLGSEMDFVESRLSSEFVFRNPNIKGTCGCGESFNM